MQTYFFLWKLTHNLWVATLTLENPILTPFHTLVLHPLCFSPESIMTTVTQGDFEFHRPSHFLLSRTTLSYPHVFIYQRRLLGFSFIHCVLTGSVISSIQWVLIFIVLLQARGPSPSCFLVLLTRARLPLSTVAHEMLLAMLFREPDV